jgi:hypothetical protein
VPSSDTRAELLLDVLLGTLMQPSDPPSLAHLLLGFDTSSPPTQWYYQELLPQHDYSCLSVLLRALQVGGLLLWMREGVVLFAFVCTGVEKRVSSASWTTPKALQHNTCPGRLRPMHEVSVCKYRLATLVLIPLYCPACLYRLSRTACGAHPQEPDLHLRKPALFAKCLQLLYCISEPALTCEALFSLLQPSDETYGQLLPQLGGMLVEALPGGEGV